MKKDIKDITKIDILIMSILKKENAISKYSTMSREEIRMYNGDAQLCCKQTLNVRTVLLLELGYIAEGIKDRKASTFYITKKGIELLEEG